MENLTKLVGAVTLLVALSVILAVIMALPTMLVWNWLMPELFGFKTITFFQALGLNLLCAILFKGSGSTSQSKE